MGQWHPIGFANRRVEALTLLARPPLAQHSREIGAIDVVMAVILVILVVGIVTEQLFFTRLERWVNRRWGLVGAR